MENHDIYCATLADTLVKQFEPYKSVITTSFMRPAALAMLTDDAIEKNVMEQSRALGYHRDDAAAVVQYAKANKERVFDGLVEALKDPMMNTALIKCFEEALAA